jgi:hypothetical protein
MFNTMRNYSNSWVRFKNHNYITYIVIGAILQIISLFRNYPMDHPCGKVFSLNDNVSVLINCDSAVFMKDAQDPSRLFDGRSVYQDRPLPTMLVSLAAKAWHMFKLPDQYRNVIGNSGQITNYSLITYLFFLIMNLVIFLVSCWMIVKILKNLFDRYQINTVYFPPVAILAILVVSLNEITKTFFWTAHSQMFNLLLPVYLFYLLQHSGIKIDTKFYFFSCSILLLLMFSYAFFILSAIPLLLINWKSIKVRAFVLTLVLATYFSYPFLMEVLGGNFYSHGLERYRSFVWIFDTLKDDVGAPTITANFTEFLKTFPIIPLIFLFLGSIFILLMTKLTLSQVFNPIKREMYLFLLYFIFLASYGYYARRLTYPLIIFLFLMVLKTYLINLNTIKKSKLNLIFYLLVSFMLISWIYTNGPLV